MTPLERQRFEIRLRAIHCDPQRFIDKHPDDPVALCALVARKIQRCDWKDLNAYTERLRFLVKNTDAYTDSTFCYIGTTSEEQYVNMLRGTAARYPGLGGYDKNYNSAQGKKIKLGYLSSDFHEHATAYLMAGLFEYYDREKFQVYAFSCGADDHSPMRARLKVGVDEFIDLSGIKDYALAARIIASHGIDILIDLKGYTAGHSADIVAARPAALIVSYLGWPATTGGLCDYIIADPIAIPAHNRQFFSEKVIWLKGSYQINDDKQVAGKTLLRAEYGLPESGLVFSNFNQAYKITPAEWGAWMKCLLDYPDAVLWQYQVQPEALENLRAEAESFGVNPARIIPAKHINRAGHLARYGTAGLTCLDTSPVCGHTTNSDALRMGKMPCKMSDAQVPDTLISNVTKSLVANKDTLFDTVGKVREIEGAFTRIWQMHLDGAPLDHLQL